MQNVKFVSFSDDTIAARPEERNGEMKMSKCIICNCDVETSDDPICFDCSLDIYCDHIGEAIDSDMKRKARKVRDKGKEGKCDD